jgi:AcrR family transcriptional regulator
MPPRSDDARPTAPPATPPPHAPHDGLESGPGRRRREGGSRAAILQAAQAAFAEVGYERATIRSIARGAGVDPALVLHYFDSKAALFTAALRLPVSPAELVGAVLADPDPAAKAELGETVVRAFLAAWEPPQNRQPLVAMLRSALTNEIAQQSVRAYLTDNVFAPLTRALGAPDGELRATLVGSQFIGLATMRYVLRAEPLASASPAWITAALGPTIQRYLMEPLSLDGDATRR